MIDAQRDVTKATSAIHHANIVVGVAVSGANRFDDVIAPTGALTLAAGTVARGTMMALNSDTPV
jgi:hypothetical protein